MAYSEKENIHKDITFEEFTSLTEEQINNNQIYFITDVSSQAEFLTRLIENLEAAADRLEELLSESGG